MRAEVKGCLAGVWPAQRTIRDRLGRNMEMGRSQVQHLGLIPRAS